MLCFATLFPFRAIHHVYKEKTRSVALAALRGVFIAVSWLVLALSDILTPFIVAAVLAYILNPWWKSCATRNVARSRIDAGHDVRPARTVGTAADSDTDAADTVSKPGRRLPQLIDFVQNKALPWLNSHFGAHIPLNKETLLSWLQSHTGTLQNTASKIAPALVAQGGALASGLSNLALLPLLLYYFLYDWQRWSHGIRALMPRRFIDAYTRIGGEIDEVLGEFLRGQLMVMLIMGVVYGVGLMLTGLDSGFAIGMIAGLLVFIPYLGAFTGLLLATIAALLQFGSWQGLIWVWLVFVVGQLLESFLVTPKIVGDRIGLSPFWVIFSLMAFGQLMGFVGMLIGLPLAAICLVLLREGSQVYFASHFYQHK